MVKKQNIDTRKIQILGLIVKEYIETGNVTGSKSLVKNEADLNVSSATVRNDMNNLEQMGLIYQPYNSAGRLPTTRGIRMYVDYLMDIMPQYYLKEGEPAEEVDEDIPTDKMYDLVAELSRTSGEIAFIVVPELNLLYYIGISNFLKKNSAELGEKVFDVIDTLENRYAFLKLMGSLDLSSKVNVYIGEENVIPELSDCSIVAKKITYQGARGYLGILGSKRTDYAFTITSLRNIFSK